MQKSITCTCHMCEYMYINCIRRTDEFDLKVTYLEIRYILRTQLYSMNAVIMRVQCQCCKSTRSNLYVLYSTQIFVGLGFASLLIHTSSTP